MEKKEVKHIADVEAKKEVRSHEHRMHAKGMKAGGVTSMEMKRVGRNMARAMNQKHSGRGR